MVILKAYLVCLATCFVLACVLNSVEGDTWLESDVHGHGTEAHGSSALDECFWFVTTTMHGIAFGEFMTRGTVGRLIAMLCCSLGYWFILFMMSIIMLSQLPGERAPRLYDVAQRMVTSLWPSYTVFLSVVVGCGCMLGPYLSRDKDGRNGWATGVYFSWTLAHRMPYGDIWPDTPWGRFMTICIMFLGVIYMPYVLALVSVRCPSSAQHATLLENVRDRPADALGRGYIVPKEAGGNESLQEYVMHEYTPSGAA